MPMQRAVTVVAVAVGLRDVQLVGPVHSQLDIPEADITAVAAVVGMVDTFVEATIMEGVIMVAIADTITEGMHPEVPYSELFSVDSLLEASTVHSGGLSMRYPYLLPTMTRTTNFLILHLPM